MPTSSLVSRKKVILEQAVELSIELAPYIMAYKNYKNVLDVQGGFRNSAQERVFQATYEDVRLKLMDSLSALTGGSLEDVFDLAMDTDRLKQIRTVASSANNRINFNESMKKSAAYEALDDSFVEILSNAVDETIAKHLASSKAMKPISSLKATLLVTIDDHSNPDNLTISCLHKKGRGFKKDFLQQVSTIEERKAYISKVSSNKLSEAKLLADIPLFIGGRGQGLRMLMRKLDEGTYSESDRKHATKLNKAPVSSIEFSNKMDMLGKKEGALITITTSKLPVVIIKEQAASDHHELDAREVMCDMKQRNMDAKKSTESISLNMDFLHDASGNDKQGSASPLGLDMNFISDNTDGDSDSSASPIFKK